MTNSPDLLDSTNSPDSINSPVSTNSSDSPIIKKKEYNIYIYQKTHLPRNGWLQGCFRCYNITAETMLFPQNYKQTKNFVFYTCPKCKFHINARGQINERLSFQSC